MRPESLMSFVAILFVIFISWFVACPHPASWTDEGVIVAVQVTSDRGLSYSAVETARGRWMVRGVVGAPKGSLVLLRDSGIGLPELVVGGARYPLEN